MKNSRVVPQSTERLAVDGGIREAQLDVGRPHPSSQGSHRLAHVVGFLRVFSNCWRMTDLIS